MNTSRRPTALRKVAIAQLRMLYKEKFLAGLLGVVLLDILLKQIVIARTYEFAGLPPWEMVPPLATSAITLIFVGIIAAALAWFNEPPSRRSYHHSLPVNHRLHDSMRLLAGVAWLVVALIFFCVVGALTEDRVMREQWLMHAPTVWFSFFALPLLVYLLCSIFVVAFDRMVVWIVGITFVALLMDSGIVAVVLPEASDTARAIVWDPGAPYSLAHVLTGAQRSAPWMGRHETERVLAATADQYLRDHPELHKPMQTREQRAESIKQLRDLFRIQLKQSVPASPLPWLKALGIWFTIALCGLTLAVMRKPVG